jgi:LETM1-like protein
MTIVPALLYAVLPFTIPTIPFIIGFFPGLLPSVFTTPDLLKKKFIAIENKRKDTVSVLQSFSSALDAVDVSMSPVKDASNQREKLKKFVVDSNAAYWEDTSQ